MDPPLPSVDHFICELEEQSGPFIRSLDNFIEEVADDQRRHERNLLAGQPRGDARRDALFARLERVRRRRASPTRAADESPSPAPSTPTPPEFPLATGEVQFPLATCGVLAPPTRQPTVASPPLRNGSALFAERRREPRSREPGPRSSVDSIDWGPPISSCPTPETHDTPRLRPVKRRSSRSNRKTSASDKHPRSTGDANKQPRSASYAIPFSLRSTIDRLRRRGAAIAPQSSTAAALFLQACLEQRTPAVRFLLDRGCPVNARNGNGDSALVLSLRDHSPGRASCDRLALCDLLIRRGVDICAENRSGRSAFFFAARHPVEFCRLLQRAGAALLVRDHHGFTPLHEAAAASICDTMEFLIELGYDVDSRSNSGYSVLHAAVTPRRRSANAVALLLEAGADPTPRERLRGQTPLHLAAAKRANPRVVDLLLRYGADPLALDWDGRTALDLSEDAARADPENLRLSQIVRRLRADYSALEPA
ncbi:MAG: ankyrin repeat domain-containing protein [Myxococcales bacterium]|nr:ankyrin repeat domain-containing protein [Myxococcales bacterium]